MHFALSCLLSLWIDTGEVFASLVFETFGRAAQCFLTWPLVSRLHLAVPCEDKFGYVFTVEGHVYIFSSVIVSRRMMLVCPRYGDDFDHLVKVVSA